MRNSTMWNHFIMIDANKAECKYCDLCISTTGGSTNNLKRHLMRRHPEVSVVLPVSLAPRSASLASSTSGHVDSPQPSSRSTSSNGQGGQKANNKGMKSKVITEGLKTGERKALRNGGEPRISPSGSQADGNSRSNEELKTSRIIKRSTLQVPASPPPAKRKVEEKELSATVKTLLPADFEDGQTYVPVSISEECDAMSTLWATKMRKLVEDQRVLAENLITQVLTKAYFGELTRRTLILDTVPSKSEPNLPRAYIGVE